MAHIGRGHDEAAVIQQRAAGRGPRFQRDPPAKPAAAEQQIVAEVIAVQQPPVDLGGYYMPDDTKAAATLRPSKTFNAILAAL